MDNEEIDSTINILTDTCMNELVGGSQQDVSATRMRRGRRLEHSFKGQTDQDHKGGPGRAAAPGQSDVSEGCDGEKERRLRKATEPRKEGQK